MNDLHKTTKAQWWLKRVDEEIVNEYRRTDNKPELSFNEICGRVWQHANPDYRTHDPAVHMAEDLVYEEIANIVEEYEALDDEEKQDYYSEEYRAALQKIIDTDWICEIPLEVAGAAVEYWLEALPDWEYDQLGSYQNSYY